MEESVLERSELSQFALFDDEAIGGPCGGITKMGGSDIRHIGLGIAVELQRPSTPNSQCLGLELSPRSSGSS